MVKNFHFTKTTIKRIHSGVPGFDKMIGGGLIENSISLLSGKTGSGKTIFATQFLVEGIKDNEKTIMFLTEQKKEIYYENMKNSIGIDLEIVEKMGYLKVVEIDPANINELRFLIQKNVVEMQAQRLIIDSITLFFLFSTDLEKTRHALFQAIRDLKKLKITVLFTAEREENSDKLSSDVILDYLSDNIFILDLNKKRKGFERTIRVRKLRQSKQSYVVKKILITNKGVKVVR